jgi:hypothetical protein
MLLRIKEMLSPEELAFLDALKEVTEESESVMVSEAARRINITPQKGHDIFRRIKRRAKKGAPPPILRKVADRAPLGHVSLSLDDLGISENELLVLLDDAAGLTRWAKPTPPVPSTFFRTLALLGARWGFEEFYRSLDPKEQELWDHASGNAPS